MRLIELVPNLGGPERNSRWGRKVWYKEPGIGAGALSFPGPVSGYVSG